MQMADELIRFQRIPEGSGADSTQGSGGFRRRWLIRCWRVRAQIADKVPEGSDADA